MSDKPNPAIALIASNVLKQAQERCSLILIQAALRQFGIEKVDGLSFDEWVAKHLPDCVQDVLEKMEDVNPGTAAAVQEHLEKIMKKLGS